MRSIASGAPEAAARRGSRERSIIPHLRIGGMAIPEAERSSDTGRLSREAPAAGWPVPPQPAPSISAAKVANIASSS